MTTLKHSGITSLAIALVMAAGAAAQTTTGPEGFSFKGNPLGMTLAEFKVANPTAPCFTKQDIDAFGKYEGDLAMAGMKASMAQAKVDVLQSQLYAVKGKEAKAAAKDAINAAILDVKKAQDDLAYMQQHAPQKFPWAVGIDVQASDAIACSSASSAFYARPAEGDANPDGLKVGSAMASAVVYQFLKGRLYRLSVLFPAPVLNSIKDAFTTKYGEPTALAPDAYQNGFGASWKGANFAWISGHQEILLHEGPGNGPGQDSRNEFSDVTYDDHLLEPVAVKAATNF
jgi:hypothetical protein